MTWRCLQRFHRTFLLGCRSGSCGRRLITLRCGDRTCSFCRVKDYYRLLEKYAPALREIHRPKLITLTLVNYPDLTRDGVSHLRQCMKALFERLEGIIRGGLYAIEATNRGRGWHVHVHVLADADFIPQGELSRIWHEITGDSFIVDVRAVDSPGEALRYLLKYLTKDPFIQKGDQARGEVDVQDGNAEEWIRRTFNEALKGVRLIHSFGSLYAYRPTRRSRSCRTCGCSDWVLISILLAWPEDIFGSESPPPGEAPAS